jgi:hypothetical protein
MSLDDLFREGDFIPTIIRSIPIIMNAIEARKISEYAPSICEPSMTDMDNAIHISPTATWKILSHFGLIKSPDVLIPTTSELSV